VNIQKYLVVFLLLLVTACQSQHPKQSCEIASGVQRQPHLGVEDFTRLEETPRKNKDRQQAVLEYFKRCPQLSMQKIGQGPGLDSNIICTISGPSSKQVVVGAHFDNFGMGQGVADNWSGIVLVSRLVDLLSATEPNLTWTIVAFAEEESGLLGSRAFVRAESGKENANDMIAMINIDTVGIGDVNLDPRSDPTLKCLARHIAEQLEIDIRSQSLSMTSGDWAPFRRKGIPFLNLHSLDRRKIEKIHGRMDNLKLLNKEKMEDAWQILINLQKVLDQDSNKNSNWVTQASRSVPSSFESNIPI